MPERSRDRVMSEDVFTEPALPEEISIRERVSQKTAYAIGNHRRNKNRTDAETNKPSPLSASLCLAVRVLALAFHEHRFSTRSHFAPACRSDEEPGLQGVSARAGKVGP